MRIRLGLVNDQLQIAAVFRAGYRTNMALVDFVVDTGSNKSMIGYGDAVRLHIPFNSLKFDEKTRIGGFVYELYKLKDVKLGLADEENKIFKIDLGDFPAAKTPERGLKEKEEAKQIPSILGIDFLMKYCFALYCNPAKNVMYLEK